MTDPKMKVAQIDGARKSEYYAEADAIIERRKEVRDAAA